MIRSDAPQVAAVMPVFGEPELTAAALADLGAQHPAVTTWVVDNRGDHRGDAEQVIRPGTNLGWLGGTNVGIEAARAAGRCTHLLLLNNDVRLSPGLVGGLLAAGADIAAPCYDGFWNHQKTSHVGNAVDFRPGRFRWRAPFVDGTCLLVSTRLLDVVGPLDPAFEPYGWGAEVDLGFRAVDAGFRVVVTDAAFVEHAGEGTAAKVHPEGYGLTARAHMYGVLEKRYGTAWERRAGISPVTHNTTYVRRRRRVQQTISLALRP